MIYRWRPERIGSGHPGKRNWRSAMRAGLRKPIFRWQSRNLSDGTRRDHRYRAQIYPNATSRDGFWCSFSPLEGLIAKLPMRGSSPMKTHRSLWHVIMRTGGSIGRTRREPSTRTVRAQVTRGILVLGLALGSLGAAAPALGSTGPVRASAHQPAARPLAAGAGSMSSCSTSGRPWMYTPMISAARMIAFRTSGRPWMYTPMISATGTIAFRPAPRAAGRGVAGSLRHGLQRHAGCLFRWLRGPGCRAALLASTSGPVVITPLGHHRLRCAARP